jgi:hypothetical protein
VATLAFMVSRPDPPRMPSRLPVVASDSPYREEMLCRFAYGPLEHDVRSPNGAYMASMVNRCSNLSRFLSAMLLLDRCYVHETQVWRAEDKRVTSVMDVKDFEPGSGTQHAFFWSCDSQALFITGNGTIVDAYEGPLCIVYLPATDELYRLRECPPTGDVRNCRPVKPCG